MISHSKPPVILALAAALLIVPAPRRALAQADEIHLKVTSNPLHQGRISPMLYGGFIELLDDHVPGMWAEMLGDRGFEGILPTSYWDYFRGEPNLCDRDWDREPRLELRHGPALQRQAVLPPGYSQGPRRPA